MSDVGTNFDALRTHILACLLGNQTGDPFADAHNQNVCIASFGPIGANVYSESAVILLRGAYAAFSSTFNVDAVIALAPRPLSKYLRSLGKLAVRAALAGVTDEEKEAFYLAVLMFRNDAFPPPTFTLPPAPTPLPKPTPIPLPPIIIPTTPPVLPPTTPLPPPPSPPPPPPPPVPTSVPSPTPTNAEPCVSMATEVSKQKWGQLIGAGVGDDIIAEFSPLPPGWDSTFYTEQQIAQAKFVAAIEDIPLEINGVLQNITAKDAMALLLPDMRALTERNKISLQMVYGLEALTEYFQVQQQRSQIDIPIIDRLPKTLTVNNGTGRGVIGRANITDDYALYRNVTPPSPPPPSLEGCFVPIRNLKSTEPHGYGYKTQLQIVFVNGRGATAKQITIPNPTMNTTAADIKAALTAAGAVFTVQGTKTTYLLYFGNKKFENDLLPYGQIRYHGQNAVQGRQVTEAMAALCQGTIKPQTFRGQQESEKDRNIIVGMFRASRAYIFDFAPNNPTYPEPYCRTINLK